MFNVKGQTVTLCFLRAIFSLSADISLCMNFCLSVYSLCIIISGLWVCVCVCVCLTCLPHEPPLRHVDCTGLISSDTLSNLTLIHYSKPCPNMSGRKLVHDQLEGKKSLLFTYFRPQVTALHVNWLCVPHRVNVWEQVNKLNKPLEAQRRWYQMNSVALHVLDIFRDKRFTRADKYHRRKKK